MTLLHSALPASSGWLLALLTGVVLSTGGAAAAADKPASSADARYQNERAACDNGGSSQDRATCLKESGAAKDEARRGQLANGGSASTRDQNAIDRCNALPSKDRGDCMARIQGPATPNQRTQTSGSVAGGGIIRETTTTISASAPSGVRPAATPR